MNCRIIEMLCVLNICFHSKQNYFINVSFKVANRPCWNINLKKKPCQKFCIAMESIENLQNPQQYDKVPVSKSEHL